MKMIWWSSRIESNKKKIIDPNFAWARYYKYIMCQSVLCWPWIWKSYSHWFTGEFMKVSLFLRGLYLMHSLLEQDRESQTTYIFTLAVSNKRVLEFNVSKFICMASWYTYIPPQSILSLSLSLSLSHSLTHSLTHVLAHSLTHSLTHTHVHTILYKPHYCPHVCTLLIYRKLLELQKVH